MHPNQSYRMAHLVSIPIASPGQQRLVRASLKPSLFSIIKLPPPLTAFKFLSEHKGQWLTSSLKQALNKWPLLFHLVGLHLFPQSKKSKQQQKLCFRIFKYFNFPPGVKCPLFLVKHTPSFQLLF